MSLSGNIQTFRLVTTRVELFGLVGRRGTNNLTYVSIFFGLEYFKKMYFYTIGRALVQSSILSKREIHITILPHSSVMQDISLPAIIIDRLDVIRDNDKSICFLCSTHPTLGAAPENVTQFII